MVTGKKLKPQISKQEKAEKQKIHQAQVAEHKERIARTWNSFDTHFAAGNVDAAIAVVSALKRQDPTQNWDERRLLKLIQHFVSGHDWTKTCYYSQEYLRHFDSKANSIRLNLAKIYIVKQESPKKGLRVLKQLDINTLDDKSKKVATQLATRAQDLIQSGTIEFEDD